jgi:YggT family protein
MYIIGHFFKALAIILNFVLMAYMWIVIARAVLSWVSPDPYNPIVRFIHTVTEPVLYRIRSLLPLNFGGIDITPVIVILIVYFLRIFLVPSLLSFGNSLII